MNLSALGIPLISACSIAWGGAMAVKAVRVLSTPPPVSGVGVYNGGPVFAGETVAVVWNIKKHVDCPGEDSRHWNGGGGFYLRGATGKTGLPKSDEPRAYVIPTQIPKEAPPGPLSLSIKGSYDCPEGELHFTLGPVAFEVEARNGLR